MSLLNKLGSHLKVKFAELFCFMTVTLTQLLKILLDKGKQKKKSKKRRQPNQNTKKVKMTWVDGQKLRVPLYHLRYVAIHQLVMLIALIKLLKMAAYAAVGAF